MRLKLCTYVSSEEFGYSSVTTLIVGSQSAVLIDPPLYIADVQSVTSFVGSKTSNPVTAIFVTNHELRSDIKGRTILTAFPNAKLYAAPYVYEKLVRQHHDLFPEGYDFSFFTLPGDMTSPVMLLGPVQGSCADHTLFWLPTERTIIAGDAVFARNLHVNLQKITSSEALSAWRLTLDLIFNLDPVTIVTGRIQKGTQFDAKKDIEHMYRYLDMFEDRIIRPIEDDGFALGTQELYQSFKEAFPNCEDDRNLFLEKTAGRFGSDRTLAEQNDGPQSPEQKIMGNLDGFVMS